MSVRDGFFSVLTTATVGLCRLAAGFSLSYDNTFARTWRVNEYPADRIVNDWISVRQRNPVQPECDQKDWRIKSASIKSLRLRYTNPNNGLNNLIKKPPHTIIEFVKELSKSSWMLSLFRLELLIGWNVWFLLLIN